MTLDDVIICRISTIGKGPSYQPYLTSKKAINAEVSNKYGSNYNVYTESFATIRKLWSWQQFALQIAGSRLALCRLGLLFTYYLHCVD